MTEYMTFENAVNSSEPNDRLVNEPWFQDFKKSVWKETVLQGACALSDKWQVKKEEPEVLTYHEWNKRWNEKYRSEKPGYHQVYEAGDKNGQLKEWLNHKELREASQIITENQSGYKGSLLGNLAIALQNLKSLNE